MDRHIRVCPPQAHAITALDVQPEWDFWAAEHTFNVTEGVRSLSGMAAPVSATAGSEVYTSRLADAW